MKFINGRFFYQRSYKLPGSNIYLVKKLSVNRKTASKYLKELEEHGFLSHLQVGKEIVYINNELMEILKNEIAI
jgi:predicted transcriptional regulator